jgi:hypothetical protein
MSQIDTENKDVMLAMAIAAGASSTTAAQQLDLSRSTVKRRMGDADFRQLVGDLRREMLTSALGRMANNMTRAADTVAALLDVEQPQIRLRAARALLTLGLRLHDSVEASARMDAIEQALAQYTGSEFPRGR